MRRVQHPTEPRVAHLALPRHLDQPIRDVPHLDVAVARPPTQHRERCIRVKPVAQHQDALGLLDRLARRGRRGDGGVGRRSVLGGELGGQVQVVADQPLDLTVGGADTLTHDDNPALGVLGPDPVVEVERLAGSDRLLERLLHAIPVAVVLVLEEELGGRLDLARLVTMDRKDVLVPRPAVVAYVVLEPAGLPEVVVILEGIDHRLRHVRQAVLAARRGTVHSVHRTSLSGLRRQRRRDSRATIIHNAGRHGKKRDQSVSQEPQNAARCSASAEQRAAHLGSVMPPGRS